MGASFFASTAIALIVGVITLSTQYDKLTVAWHALSPIGVIDEQLWLMKIMVLLIDMLSAFVFFSQSDSSHVARRVVISVPTATVRPALVSAMLIQAGRITRVECVATTSRRRCCSGCSGRCFCSCRHARSSRALLSRQVADAPCARRHHGGIAAVSSERDRERVASGVERPRISAGYRRATAHHRQPRKEVAPAVRRECGRGGWLSRIRCLSPRTLFAYTLLASARCSVIELQAGHIVPPRLMYSLRHSRAELDVPPRIEHRFPARGIEFVGMVAGNHLHQSDRAAVALREGLKRDSTAITAMINSGSTRSLALAVRSTDKLAGRLPGNAISPGDGGGHASISGSVSTLGRCRWPSSA